MISPAKTCWPSRLEENLLRATLLDGEAGLQAWQRWRAEVDLDRIEPDSSAILPSLSANLQSLGIDESLTALLKGVRRQTWAANHRLMKAAATPLQALEAARIPLLLLKGAALALVYYRDFGLRTFAAVDVLAPADRVEEASALLERAGWVPVFREQRFVAANYLRLLSALSFRNSDGMSIALHWHIMPDNGGVAADEAFWRASQTVVLEGLPVRVLGPADQLLHAIADGIRFEGESKLQWAVDALTILRTPDSRVDWARLVAMSQELRLTMVVRDALCYLRDRLAAPIPAGVIAELRALPATRAERFDHLLRTRAHGDGSLNVLRRLWRWHRRLSDSPNPIRLLASFPRFLRSYYEIDSPWRLPGHVAGRALGRMRNRTLKPRMNTDEHGSEMFGKLDS